MRHNPPSRRERRLERRQAAAEAISGFSPRDRARLERCARRAGRRVFFGVDGLWLEEPSEPGRQLLYPDDAAELLAAARRWEAHWQRRRTAWRAWRRGVAREPEPGLGHSAHGNPSHSEV